MNGRWKGIMEEGKEGEKKEGRKDSLNAEVTYEK